MNSVKGNIFDFKLFSKIMEFVSPYKRTFYFVLITAILLSVLSIVTPYLLKTVVDDYISLGDFNGMVSMISLMFTALIFEVIFQFLFVYYANWLGQRVIRDLRVKLLDKILSFKMAFFDQNSVGRLVTRAVNDMETIASIFSQGLFMILADFLKMGTIIIVMLIVDWRLSLIVFSILPIIIYATRLFQSSMKRAFEEVRLQVANLNSFVQERINGIKVVQLFDTERLEFKKFEKINEKHKKAWLKTVWYNSIFFPIAEFSSSIAIGLLVWFGGLNVIVEGIISLGTIFLFIQMSQMLFRPLRHIADKFNTLQMGMVAAERVFKLIDRDEKIKNLGNISVEKIKGSISFENINFSYLSNEQVLHQINLNVKQGEKIAIVGSTGAGKSTIINLLSRFYEYDTGNIFIDNIPIKDFSIKSLRNHLGVILQDVFLFADTIYNNIVLYDTNIKEEDVYKAANEIGVHNFISSLPGGYQYNVKERGVMLSSGQRQLIAFLRVYLSNPSILVLDEATSSIDSYSEDLIQIALKKITENKTAIVIAHRLSTIKNSDRIVVMDKGRIVEVGNHEELISIEGGYYSQLYQIQFLQEAV